MRLPMHSIGFLFAAALAGVACSDSATSESSSPLGCYALTLGRWDHPPEEGLIHLPEQIILTDERGTDVLENDRLLVRAYPDITLQAYRWSWWEPAEGDSLRIVWSTGFSGIEMMVGRSGADYRGVARNFVDYPIDVSTASVTLDRITCS